MFSLQQAVDLVALLQHLVQIVLADDVAQAGQRQLVHGRGRIGHRDDGFGRIDDPVPEHGIHLDGHAVARDGFLLLRRDGTRADVDA